MMEAADSSHIKMLLEKGADYAVRDNDKNTALHWAAGRGLDNAVTTLLETARRDYMDEPHRFHDFLNHQEKDGRTALMAAAQQKRQSTIQLLLEYGADPYVEDNDGSRVLRWAAIGGLDDTIKTLLKRVKDTHHHNPQRFREFIDHGQKRNRTALLEAAERN